MIHKFKIMFLLLLLSSISACSTVAMKQAASQEITPPKPGMAADYKEFRQRRTTAM